MMRCTLTGLEDSGKRALDEAQPNRIAEWGDVGLPGSLLSPEILAWDVNNGIHGNRVGFPDQEL
jgi:hypothetical protein